MSSSRTLDLSLWLYGTPVFSLSYIPDGDDVRRYELQKSNTSIGNFTDITGYRPDPRDILKKNKKYKATGKFNRETDYGGKDIWILREVNIEGVAKFVYIR